MATPGVESVTPAAADINDVFWELAEYDTGRRPSAVLDWKPADPEESATEEVASTLSIPSLPVPLITSGAIRPGNFRRHTVTTCGTTSSPN